ncbi:MAG: ATP synthase subunit I [Candidatus Scalindua sp. AMX11]|nr:MAG: ATP synthase subunit I [Candidatus Scalindua sp.]NOG84692.1 ATP synthase subunit I [Planctomycetota bacterium]RZV98305.1 MAG: ATP synthase subunit I [Candidatus Scalindua sp. SCAELEC01]TDE66603.1 MAG: ATP synthase subunit I [Candidatus Scalindua sp. AMX11]GJQ58978.1 MAG: F1F0 ATPase [Candidatus Scalindua sp.]
MKFASEIFPFVTPFFAGIFVSLFYHIGLWWTVKSLPSTHSPALLSIGSFYIRMGITLFVFYLVMNNRWERVAVCLFGFLVVKYIMTRMLRPGENASHINKR